MHRVPDQLLAVASKSSFLKGLEPRELKTVLAAGQPRRFFANSVVTNQGDRVLHFYLFVEGRARYFYITPEGRKLTFTLILPGETFGLAALVATMNSYLASVEVLTPSRVLSWDKATIRALALRYPRLLDNSLSIAAGYIDELIAAHIRLACHNAPLRLSQALVNLAREAGTTNLQGVELTVTNEELANAANVTPFTVSRLIREWHRSGALVKTRRKIVLCSPEQLFETRQ